MREAGRQAASGRAIDSRSASIIKQVAEQAAESGLIQTGAILASRILFTLGGALGSIATPPCG